MLPFLTGEPDRTGPTRPRFLGPLLSHPETLAVTLRQALDVSTRNLYRDSIRKGIQPAPDPVLAAHLGLTQYNQ